MVKAAKERVKGTFVAADMCHYVPEGEFAAMFILYSYLGLKYAAFHATAFKLAKALQPGNSLVIGQCPIDGHLGDDDLHWVESHSYVEDFNLPFWGEPFPTFMMSRIDQNHFLRSMGMEVVYNEVDWFRPDHPKCDPELQQYVIARRLEDQSVSEPQPSPQNDDQR